MKQTKYILPVVLSLFVLGAGCSLTQTVRVNSNVAVQTNQTANTNTTAAPVAYSGQEGKTALDLLDAVHEVEVSDQGFVNTIDGIKPGNRQYWAFYVNGKLAEVGAKEYETKADDKIEWKLETY